MLDLLLELQALDRLPRTGYLQRGVPDPESVAEHSFHVAFLAWALAPEEAGFDRARAVAMALVHDLAEVRTGDLPRGAARYLPPGAKRAAEEAAFAALARPLGAEAAALHAEYEEGASREAAWVRACDRLQLMVKVLAYEGWGAGGLAEFWRNPANFPDTARFPALAPLVEALRGRRGALAAPPR